MVADHIKFPGQILLHLAQSTLKVLVHLLPACLGDFVNDLERLLVVGYGLVVVA